MLRLGQLVEQVAFLDQIELDLVRAGDVPLPGRNLVVVLLPLRLDARAAFRLAGARFEEMTNVSLRRFGRSLATRSTEPVIAVRSASIP